MVRAHEAPAERSLEAVATAGVDVVVLRLGTLFGVSPAMRTDLMVNRMVRDAVVSRRITLDRGGRRCRPFIHGADAADVIVRAVRAAQSSGFRRYDVGRSGGNATVAEVASLVQSRTPNVDVVMTPGGTQVGGSTARFAAIGELVRWRGRCGLPARVDELLPTVARLSASVSEAVPC